MVVVAVSVVVAALVMLALQRVNDKSWRLCCNCNLKQLGTAYRVWANDNGNQFPAFTPLTNRGWSDLLARTNASTYCWTNYVTMANEIGQAPLLLICPSDVRQTAASFSDLANTNISYFVGVDANDSYPQSFLGGDRNLGPGMNPDPQYGFSPADGRGNDVVIKGPVCWSLKMHSRGNPAGQGNILLGDGSAQQVTTGNLNQYWLKNALLQNAAHDKTTNVAAPRLIFP
jgi:hypothetical protein